MLGVRLTAAARKGQAGGEASSRAASPAASSSSHPTATATPPPPLILPFGLFSIALPADFHDRVLVGFFGATVIGQLYTWPLAAFLLASAPSAAAALWHAGHSAAAAAVVACAALLLLYLRFILTAGFREAELTPNVLDSPIENKQKKWFQTTPLKKWRQWTRLRRHTGAALVRAGPPLDPSRAYVWAGYPHGISAISAFSNLVVDPAPLLGEPEEAQQEQEQEQEQEADSKGEGAAAAADAKSADTACHRGRFGDLFPGIAMHPMTLASNFKAPLVREYCLSLGLRPATRTSCAAVLTEPAAPPPPLSPLPSASPLRGNASASVAATAKQEGGVRHRRPAADEKQHAAATTTTTANDGGDDDPAAAPPPQAAAFRPSPGRAIFLSPGGAAEALLVRPGGQYDVILARRKGFCRVAVATGADVVPVVMFGETELFDVVPLPPGSLGWRLQRLSHKTFGTSQPIFRGEGLLGADRTGLLPRRWAPGCGRPRLTTVVGQPVRNEGGGPWVGSSSSSASASSPSSSSPSSWPPRIPKSGADPAFEAAVDALHARYVAALKALFSAHVQRFHPGAVLRIADEDEGAGKAGAGGGGEGSAGSSSRMMHH